MIHAQTVASSIELVRIRIVPTGTDLVSCLSKLWQSCDHGLREVDIEVTKETFADLIRLAGRSASAVPIAGYIASFDY